MALGLFLWTSPVIGWVGSGCATPKAPAVEAGWQTRVQQALAEREYRASRNRVGLQAPNRAHNFRTYFESSGIRVHDRTAAGSPELLGLSLAGLGRGETLTPVVPGEVVSEGARVEIRRPGLVEWYANSPAGLEQGFTLTERPGGEGALVLELAVTDARASLRGERVIFEASTQRRLAYGKLAALDARGARVPASFSVPEAGRLRIALEDRGAVYPVAIDPLLTETADTQLESDQASALLGTSVAGAGDVNGDGYADVIVGALQYDAGESNEGAAFVFLGSASGIADGDPTTAATQLESDQAGGYLGNSVAGAGDVNGDGYADVIVGARYYDAGESDEGAAFVFLGGASGIADGDPITAAAQLESDQANAYLGHSVAGAGDVDGDGYADVIVGANQYDGGESNEGAAFVFLGSASGIFDGDPTTAATQLESNQASANLGTSVGGAGDVNGDGYADVIAGARYYDAGESNEGAAFVFLGGASGIADGDPITAAAQLESDQANAYLGHSVAGAGDVDGDGYADVIVGANQYDGGESNEGAAFVFLGSASGIFDGDPTTAATQLESNQASANLGTSVGGAGDVNGDGYADVIAGARYYDAGESNEGAAFVFLGNGDGDGRPVVAQQRRGDGSGVPVQPWGGLLDSYAFEVRLDATHPEGRGRVKLEVEYCGAALAFGNASCGSLTGATWRDVRATSEGVRLSETISGLTEDELFRWRARVLYAPYSVTQSGITPPPNPAHGPWRRVSAQALEADIRVVPEPGLLLQLAPQLALLALLYRRRQRRGAA
ncbi:MAG: integrin alpha [Myxococcota bacterium]